MRTCAKLAAWILFITGLATPAGAIEIGDRVVVVNETTLAGSGGASEKLPPGTILGVEYAEASRLWVSHSVPGWVDAASVMELPAAVEHFAKILEKNPNDVAALRALGNIRRVQHRFEDAMGLLCRALRLSPDDALAHRWRAYTLVDAGLHEAAFADICTAIHLGPQEVPPLLVRASNRRLSRRTSEAIADYNEAIRLVPGSSLAYLGRGQAYADAGKLDAALADFAKALELDPRDPRILVARSDVYVRQGRDDLAVGDLESALKANPRFAPAHDRLACLYLNHRDEKFRNSAKAVEHAREACERSQWLCPDFIATLSSAYRAAGDNSRATETKIAALRTAMAETARARDWQLESFFNRCRQCNKDDLHCRCEHPDLVPGAKSVPGTKSSPAPTGPNPSTNSASKSATDPAPAPPAGLAPPAAEVPR